MAEMQEKKVHPQQHTKNIQMMRFEPREEDQCINIILRSGMATDTDKGKQPEEDGWMHKDVEKEVDFDLNRAKETFMEAKKNFVEDCTSTNHEKIPITSATQEVYPSILATFLKSCMKILRNQKVVEGLQELIDK